jgi:hypothetical protein
MFSGVAGDMSSVINVLTFLNRRKQLRLEYIHSINCPDQAAPLSR